MKKIIVAVMIALLLSGTALAAKPLIKGSVGKQPEQAETSKKIEPGSTLYVHHETGDIYSFKNTAELTEQIKGTPGTYESVPETVANKADTYGSITDVKTNDDGSYTYLFAEQKKPDEGLLEDYRHTTQTSVTVYPDDSYEETVTTTTDRRTGVLERGEWENEYQIESRTTVYNQDGKVQSTVQPVYERTEIIDPNTNKPKRDAKGNIQYEQKLTGYRESITITPDPKKPEETYPIERVYEERNGQIIPIFEARPDGTTLGRKEIAEEARNRQAIVEASAAAKSALVSFAELEVKDKNKLAEKKQTEWESASEAYQKAAEEADNAKGTPQEAEKEAASKAALEKATVANEEYEKAALAAEESKNKLGDLQGEAKQKEAEAEQAKVEADAADAAKNEKDTPEQKKLKEQASASEATKASSFWSTLKLMGTARVLGRFMKAYDTYSGLRQYSAIGLGNYDAQVQRNKAKIQQDFCLATGTVNCFTSAICGSVPDFQSDNILVGRGPSGQYVSSGVINAERSIPIELEGMTRQQLIDLFGNTTVISGRLINLTDPLFDPKILGKMKVYLYHVQYSITNNQVGELYGAGKKLTYNLRFKKAQPGSTSSYGTPVKDSKWYPADKELEYGQTGTDGNQIWKFSATEYTDACLEFEPGLPSGGAGSFSNAKVVNKLCTPFAEYAGGPTEIGKEAATITAESPKDIAGGLI